MYVEVREVGFAVAACANSRLDLPTRASMPALANEVSAECYFYKKEQRESSHPWAGSHHVHVCKLGSRIETGSTDIGLALLSTQAPQLPWWS